jgi:hypothetical protein
MRPYRVLHCFQCHRPSTGRFWRYAPGPFCALDHPSQTLHSTGKSLSIFFEGNQVYYAVQQFLSFIHIFFQLYTLDNTCADSEWTSIEMDLKKDMQGLVPKPFDLARFLSATMTFMSSVKTISVFFDGWAFLKLTKSRGLPDDIAPPSDMHPRSTGDTMQIDTVSVVRE